MQINTLTITNIAKRAIKNSKKNIEILVEKDDDDLYIYLMKHGEIICFMYDFNINKYSRWFEGRRYDYGQLDSLEELRDKFENDCGSL